MKKLITLMLSILLVISLTACSGLTTFNNFKTSFFTGEQSGIHDSKVVIGVYEPMSGEYSKLATDEVRGIEIAHKLYPTVYSLPVELIYSDNKSNMDDAKTAITDLLLKKPQVVLGSYGEVLTLVASSHLKEAKVPGITISSINPLITLNNEYFFRATYTEESQGKALADFAYGEKKLDKIAIVRVGTDDTVTPMIDNFTNRLAELSPKSSPVVTNISMVSGQDLTPVFDRIRTSGATCVLLALSTEATKDFMTKAYNYGLKYLVYIGNRTWDNDAMREYISNNPWLSIAFCVNDTQLTTELGEQFIEAYMEEYGTEPSGIAATAFDAYILAITAIQNAYDSVKWSRIPEGEYIKDELMKIENFKGASGVISYAGTNEATKTISVRYIERTQVEEYIEDVDNQLSEEDLEEEKEKE